jgi:Na+-translocating ferredoxin:NAD+ oxidoreductase RnfG subunit
MHWNSATVCGVVGLLAGMGTQSVYAKQYVTVEEVKSIFFSGELLQKVEITLPQSVHELLRKESGVRHTFKETGIWRSAQGSWLIVDEVVGKHEMITYAVGIDASGVIKGVEILQYNESYGGQIREKKWLSQFEGKGSQNHFKFNQDILNITGATLSAKHVTDGVKRVMVLYRELLELKD